MKMRKRPPLAVISVGVVAAVAMAVLFAAQPVAQRSGDLASPMSSRMGSDDGTLAADLPAWMDVELVDAVSGEAFRIRDLVGRPILLESFAVWCSICLRQQKEMARLVDLEGDRIVHVSLNTDPNEDLDKVKAHALLHGFTWYYAVAPIKMTELLIADFGLTVVNAPRAPVVLIEVDGSSRLLANGVKSAERLLEEIELVSESEEDNGG